MAWPFTSHASDSKMLRSLLIKLAMLAAAAALVLWIGWPTPGPTPEPEESAPDSLPQTGQKPPTSLPRPTELAPAAPSTVGRLDINRATIEELQHLPGIGEVLARRVVERRTAHGPFRTVEELREVKGIGARRLEQLRPLVVARTSTVSGKGQNGL